MIRVLATALISLIPMLACAGDQDRIAARLPRTFTGTFMWQDDRVRQQVEIGVEGLRQVEGKITGVGCGRYQAYGRVTEIGVRIAIDPASRHVELWETEPTNPSFNIDGSHVGALSADLQQISAIWVSRTTGRAGNLQLRAGGRLSCTAAIS